MEIIFEQPIINSGRFYLYRHTRLDKNEPFYIGIGTKRKHNVFKNHRTEYHRAYSSLNRNKMWTSIYHKAQYNIEILLESDNYEFIKQKEKEFISLYGRKDISTGTLTNLTDGGDGSVGTIHNPENWEKKVYMYAEDGTFIKSFRSTIEAGKQLGINRGIISKVATGRDKHHKKIRYLYEYKNFIEPLELTPFYKNPNFVHPANKQTLKMKDGKIVEILPSVAAYCKQYGYKSSGICKAIKNNSNAYGFQWQYL